MEIKCSFDHNRNNRLSSWKYSFSNADNLSSGKSLNQVFSALGYYQLVAKQN